MDNDNNIAHFVSHSFCRYTAIPYHICNDPITSVVFLSRISLPGQVWSIEESRSLFDHWAYFKFVTKPYLIVVSLLGILVAAQELFFEVCLSLYLHDQFAMDTVQIGCMFLAYNMPNTIMNVVYGTAVDE